MRSRPSVSTARLWRLPAGLDLQDRHRRRGAGAEPRSRADPVHLPHSAGRRRRDRARPPGARRLLRSRARRADDGGGDRGLVQRVLRGSSARASGGPRCPRWRSASASTRGARRTKPRTPPTRSRAPTARRAQVLATPLRDGARRRGGRERRAGAQRALDHERGGARQRPARLPVSPRVAGIARRATCTPPSITVPARRLSGVRPGIAGKTGTAQVANGRAHAWVYVGFSLPALATPSGARCSRCCSSTAVTAAHRATALGGEVGKLAAKRGLAR